MFIPEKKKGKKKELKVPTSFKEVKHRDRYVYKILQTLFLISSKQL